MRSVWCRSCQVRSTRGFWQPGASVRRVSLRPLRGSTPEVVAALRDWLAVEAEPEPLVVETSGSTGRPKRVLLSRRALIASAPATHERLGGPGRWLLTLPASYVAGLQVVVRSLLAGHEPAVLGDQPFAEAARDCRYVSLVPTQLHRLLADAGDREALAGFDAVLLGGGPIDPGLRARAEAAGVRVVATYGSSETCGGCVYDGVPLDGVEIDVGRGGRAAGSGSAARCSSTATTATPALTAETLVDGWFVTADLGRLDDGRLRVLGRVDDVVISGGVNVPTPAVARRLRAHPDVTAVEVIGVDDPEWGQRVVAAVVGRLTLDQARDWVAVEYPRSWAPRDLLVLDALPMLDTGKVDRLRLRRWPTPTTARTRMKVWSIPLRTRFRGIDVREGVLLPGAGRLGRVEPVPRVRRRRGRALAALRRGGGRRRLAGAAARRRPVNVTVPAIGPRARPRDRPAPAAARTAKVKVAEPGQTLGRRHGPGRGGPRRPRPRAAGSGSTSTATGTSTSAVGAIRQLDRAAGGLEYVEQPCASVEELAAVRRARGRPDRGRRVDPPGRRPVPRPRPRGRRHRGAQGAAARRGPGLPADRRGHRPARRRLLALETSVGIAAGLALAAALPELPYACGLADRPAAHRRRGRRPAAAGRRDAPGRPARRSTPDALARLAADPDRVAHWEARLAEVRTSAARCGRITVDDPASQRRHPAGPRRRRRPGRERRRRARARPRLPQRPARVRRLRRRRGRAGSGCTRASTSAPPASSPSASPRSARRAAVVCTSGTAVANLHPAVLEAAHAGLPLVVVTADRPARLRGTGANQTTDQVGIFGAARAHARPRRAPRPAAPLAPGAARCTSTSSSTSRWCPDGPLDPASPPRPSRSAQSGPTRGPPRPCCSARARSWSPATTPARRPGCSPSRPAGRCSPSPPAAPAPAPTRSAATGCSSTATLGREIERVVVFGHPTLSRPVTALLGRDDVEVVSVAAARPSGPSGRSPSTASVPAAAVDGLRRPGLARALARPPTPRSRRGLDRAAGRRGRAHAARGRRRRRAAPYPRAGCCVVGASSPIRDLDLMVAPYAVGDRRKVIANRGLSGHRRHRLDRHRRRSGRPARRAATWR